MKLIRSTSILLTALAISACNRGPEPFKMTVNNVYSMRGFVMNGLGVAGTTEQGCIANHDPFVVKRDGKVVYETTALILSLDSREAFEAPPGHNVEFYFRDAPDGVVKEGDIMEAKNTSCGKGKAE